MTTVSLPGWAGQAAYMRGLQNRGPSAPSVNFRGTSAARPISSLDRNIIQPGEPGTFPGDDAYDIPGSFNPSLGGIFHGGLSPYNTGGGAPSYISPIGTPYQFSSPMGYYLSPSGYPRAMSVNPALDPYGLSGGGGGLGSYGGGVGGFGGFPVMDMTGIGMFGGGSPGSVGKKLPAQLKLT